MWASHFWNSVKKAEAKAQEASSSNSSSTASVPLDQDLMNDLVTRSVDVPMHGVGETQWRVVQQVVYLGMRQASCLLNCSLVNAMQQHQHHEQWQQ